MSLTTLSTKCNILETKGATWAMVDLLRLFDKEHTGHVATDEYYVLFIQRLKYRYEKEKQVLVENRKEGNVTQRDLEDLINEVETETTAE